MSLKTTFGTNQKAEREGAWIEICSNADGSIARIKIARAGRRNKAYTKAMEKETRPYRAILNDLDTKTDDKITNTVLVSAIILDWEHMQVDEGTDLPFTKENALQVLTQFPDLADLINRKAWEAETFRAEQLEDEAKN